MLISQLEFWDSPDEQQIEETAFVLLAALLLNFIRYWGERVSFFPRVRLLIAVAKCLTQTI